MLLNMLISIIGLLFAIKGFLIAREIGKPKEGIAKEEQPNDQEEA